MRVEQIAEPGAEWDAFVEATSGATLGHAAAWAGVMSEAYGLGSRYLAVRDASGAIQGVLPLVVFRTLRGGRELVSLPFLDAAGILAQSQEAADALLAGALEQARACRAGAVELRHATAVEGVPASGDTHRVDLVLPLEASEEAQWKALRAKVRNQTRKAEREGLSIAEGTPEALLDDFYGPFRINMRDLGSPVHPSRLYASVARHFGERLRFVVAHLGSRSVGGLVAFDFAGVVSVPWASTLREERHRCPNNLIYWEALRWAIARGAREFDFGRSPRDGGTWRFKRGWGAEERPLAWTRLDPQGHPLPLGSAEGSALLSRLSDVWRRLPVPVASALGPLVRGRLAN
jgi:FemAB-related protein (PEP-CTERM system-associated)